MSLRGWTPEERQAIDFLTTRGFFVMRDKSYRQAQERWKVAAAQAEWERSEAESTRRWAQQFIDECAELRWRCSFLYEKAVEHGATTDELRSAS